MIIYDKYIIPMHLERFCFDTVLFTQALNKALEILLNQTL